MENVGTPASRHVALALAVGGCVMVCAATLAPARADDGDVAADSNAGFVVRHEDSLAGTIDGFDGPYGLFVREANGDVARVRMHRGTIIAPTGIELAEGMRVTISGAAGGDAFDANEIDTPYRAAYQPAYGYAPGFVYVPGFGGTSDIGATFAPALYGYGLAPFGLPGSGLAPYGLPGYGLAPYGVPGYGLAPFGPPGFATVPYGPRYGSGPYGYAGGAFPYGGYGGYPYHVRRDVRPAPSAAPVGQATSSASEHAPAYAPGTSSGQGRPASIAPVPVAAPGSRRLPRLAPPVPLAPGVLRQVPSTPALPGLARPRRLFPPYGAPPMRPIRGVPPTMRPPHGAPPAMRPMRAGPPPMRRRGARVPSGARAPLWLNRRAGRGSETYSTSSPIQAEIAPASSSAASLVSPSA